MCLVTQHECDKASSIRTHTFVLTKSKRQVSPAGTRLQETTPFSTVHMGLGAKKTGRRVLEPSHLEAFQVFILTLKCILRTT